MAWRLGRNFRWSWQSGLSREWLQKWKQYCTNLGVRSKNLWCFGIRCFCPVADASFGDSLHLHFHLGNRSTGKLVFSTLEIYHFQGIKVLWFILALIAAILAFLGSNFIIAALYNTSYSWSTVLTLLEAGRVTVSFQILTLGS